MNATTISPPSLSLSKGLCRGTRSAITGPPRMNSDQFWTSNDGQILTVKVKAGWAEDRGLYRDLGLDFDA